MAIPPWLSVRVKRLWTASEIGTQAWFSGTIVKIRGEGTAMQARVHYDDGDKFWTRVDELCTAEGETRVPCRPDPLPATPCVAPRQLSGRVKRYWTGMETRGRGGWYFGTVSRIKGEGADTEAYVHYDDGDEVWTRINEIFQADIRVKADGTPDKRCKRTRCETRIL